MQIHLAKERFHTRIDWLDSWHSFSFGHHYHPARLGFGPLRVINEDRVAGGGGFQPHGHRDMEIISWVLAGGLSHRDSTGGQGVLRPGEVQKMSAGSGVVHAEFNASATEPVHFLQIWIQPARLGIRPDYHQHRVDVTKGLTLIADGNGKSAIPLAQDAAVWAGQVAGQRLSLAGGRKLWVQMARGSAR